jgi:hypothetical protein
MNRCRGKFPRHISDRRQTRDTAMSRAVVIGGSIAGMRATHVVPTEKPDRRQLGMSEGARIGRSRVVTQ